MGDPISQAGAVKGPSRYAGVTMGGRQMTGLVTQRSPYRDGAVPYVMAKFYGASRNDTLSDGLNREISQRLTSVRAPGSSIYNSATLKSINSFYAWKYIQQSAEVVRLIADQSQGTGVISDVTGPSSNLNIWNKAPNASPTRFLGINTELFFSDQQEQKKVVQSALVWAASTLFDGAATSNTPLGDFIIDSNRNIQQAVGGFKVLIAEGSNSTPAVSIASNVLTLTLGSSQLPDPSGTPTGTASATGGSIPAGNNYIRICAVDDTGNVTEAGSESAAVATTGTTSSILWSWPAVSGAAGYRIYTATTPGGETTYFTSATNSFTQTTATSSVSGAPPSVNVTSVDVPDNLFQMVGAKLALSGFVASTFLNGVTITIASVLPGGQGSNQITAALTHSNYTAASDTGVASSGSGITGTTAPTWATTLWAVTQDGGAQWINRGSQVQNWGIAAPASAPTLNQTPAPSIYPPWSANTFYWPSAMIEVLNSGDGKYYLFQLTTSGQLGTTNPTWNFTTGATTAETGGTAVWTCLGTWAWQSGHVYSKGDYCTAAYAATGAYLHYVYQAQNTGTSGGTQTSWAFGAGAQVIDGGVYWKCIGALAPYNAGPRFCNGAVYGSAGTYVSNVNILIDSKGYMQQIQDLVPLSNPPLTGDIGEWTGGITGSSVPTWGNPYSTTSEVLSAAITAWTSNHTAGTVEFFASNVFSTSTSSVPVMIAGLITGSFFNGSWPVYANTNSTFTCYCYPSSTSSVTESGTATQASGAVWLNIGAYAAAGTAACTYVYAYGNSVTAHVGTASPASLSYTKKLGFYPVVQGFGAADPQDDTVWIFRTAQGQSTPLLLDKIANPGGGVPWSYTDTTPDSGLNAFIAAPTADANNPPPTSMTAPCYHLERVWGIVGNRVVYSGGPDTLVGSGNESFPPLNSIPFIGMPIRLVPVTVQNGGILVLTTSGIYIILGTTSNQFYSTIYYASINLAGYNALDVYNNTLFLMEANGRVGAVAVEYPFNPQTGYTEVGFPIGDQFVKVTTGGVNAALFNPANAYVSWNVESSGETALYVSDGATGWFRMSFINTPESGMLWSPLRQIAGGTSAVQSVETSPGNYQLLIGPASSGPILKRDATINNDNGTLYDSYDCKGVNLLCTTGQEAEVSHISAKSAAVGARPIVSVLMNEIAASTQRPYIKLGLGTKSNDPPRALPSVSVYSDRYVGLQQGTPLLGDCMITKFDYGTQDQPDELLDWGYYATVKDEREESEAKG